MANFLDKAIYFAAENTYEQVPSTNQPGSVLFSSVYALLLYRLKLPNLPPTELSCLYLICEIIRRKMRFQPE